MSDLANLLRATAKEMAEHDEPPSWHHPIVEAADEIEKLREDVQKLAALGLAYLSDYQEARGEIEKLRKAIRDALKLADLDAIKSFRKTLLLALGEKE